MNITNLKKQDIKECFAFLDNYTKSKTIKWIKYINLGCKVIRLLGLSSEFLPPVEKQLTYTLKDTSDNYDATLVVWKEDNFSFIEKNISPKLNPKTNLNLRIMSLVSKQKFYNFMIFDNDYSSSKPVINIESERGFLSASDYENKTFYYGVKNLDPEEFIKEGHIFVQFFNNIIKSDSSNLAHGAVIGLNDNGILMCARGQRGKSTLAVLSMMRGFEYVSDDYLILDKQDGELYSYPIYSIITLSPKMYNELYCDLEGSRFISNNARKDKYVFNISNFHNQFRKKYPVKFCLFPEIVSDSVPSIVPCEKGRAIAQLVQSTLSQTQDLHETKTVLKMIDMVKGFDFYKFNLCSDIELNTKFLRNFMNNLDKRERKTFSEDEIYLDVTFDIANIINSKTGYVYSMNKFTTNIFENLCFGAAYDEILCELKKIKLMPQNIDKNLKLFIDELNREGLLKNINFSKERACINEKFAIEDNYRLSFVKFGGDKCLELIKERENELCIK